MKKILMLFAFMCSLGLHTMYAQSQRVSGTVSDESGISLPGVSVVVKGTMIGGTTNIDGIYQIDVPQSTSILVFSFIGMESQEVAVDGKTEINVSLIQDMKSLDEVVVVGYGTQKKANLTGAVSSVKMDAILGDRPVNTIAHALQGAVAGLQLTTGNGQPGSGFDFNIRGTTSINGGSPLILVNNVPMDIDMVDPNDVESISVLKDAASTAIYGARAAFGVILITTKKADFDKEISVNYSNNFSFSQPEALPQKASIRETMRVARAMGYDPYFSNYDLNIWEAELDKYETDPSQFTDGISEVGGVFYSLREYDEFDDMMEDYGFRQQHNVSVSGGSEKASFRLALGKVDEDGVLISNKDTYSRDNISAYMKSKVNDWFTVELETRYSRSDKVSPGSGSNYGKYGAALVHPSYYPLGTSHLYDEDIPYQTSRNYIMLDGSNKKRKDDLRLFGKTMMNPFKGFNLVSEWTYNYKAEKGRNYNKKFKTLNGRTFQENYSRDKSILSLTNRLSDYKAVNVYASYEYDLSDLNMKLMAGVNHEEMDYQYLYSKATGMMNDELPSISSGMETPVQSDSYYQYAVRGYFFRANFAYKDRYLLEVNGRYDGSSRFSDNNRFGFFPSVSAGWRVTEESFMEPTRDILSNLKLRGSYGTVGNQIVKKGNDQDYYPYIPVMDSYETGWIVDGEKAKSLGTPALVSNSFTWEEVRTLDFGVDVGLFDGKFDMVFDWYRRETIGMLTKGMELPAVLGTSAPKQNAADLESTGWELQVNWRDQIGENFRYNIGFNLYDSNAKITKFDNESRLLSNYYEGENLGDIWGYTTDRYYTGADFQADGIMLNDGIAGIQGAEHKPGDVLYVDYNNDGKIDNGDNTAGNPGDMKVIGNNKRHYQYGITAGLGWKNFDMSLFFSGVGQRDMWISGDMIWPHNSEFGTIYAHQTDYWTPENTNAHYPRPRYKKSYNKKTQTKYLSDGSYIRLKNISISYRLPKELISRVGLSQVKFHVTGENLWNNNHLAEGMDPEMDRIEGGWNYPFMKKISFGANITF